MDAFLSKHPCNLTRLLILIQNLFWTFASGCWTIQTKHAILWQTAYEWVNKKKNRCKASKLGDLKTSPAQRCSSKANRFHYEEKINRRNYRRDHSGAVCCLGHSLDLNYGVICSSTLFRVNRWKHISAGFTVIFFNTSVLILDFSSWVRKLPNE